MRIESTCSRLKSVGLYLTIVAMMLFAQPMLAAQVTLLAPRDDTRVSFEKMGMRVQTFSQEQIERMDRQTAINLGQSIDASILVLTGARISSPALESLFKADEIRVALDDLFRRGGMLYLGQLSAGGMNEFSPQMRDYFQRKSLYLPQGGDRPTTEQTISHFTAYANPDLIKLPLLSKPHSLAKGDWEGTANNIFYWQNFPQTALPILTGPDNAYPVMLLQQNIMGHGSFILSQARDLTRMESSVFWENLVAYLNQTSNDKTAATPQPVNAAVSPTVKPAVKPAVSQSAKPADAKPQSKTGVQPAGDDTDKPLYFLKTFDNAAAGDANTPITDANAFTDPRIWEQFETVSLRIFNTAKQPQKATEARLGVIGKNLIAAFVCHEPDPKNIEAKVTKRDGEVWTDDSVELVLVPEKGGAVHHWLVSSKGVIYDARDRLSSWESKAVTHVKMEDNAWRAVVVIPLTDVFANGVVPDLFYANLARQERALREISSWVSPVQAIPTAKSTGLISRLSARELASQLVGRAMGDAPKSAGKGFQIWQSSAWEKGLSLSTKPASDATGAVTAVTLHLPRGGTDATLLLVRNNEPNTLVFKVNLPPAMTTASGVSIPFADLVTLYRGVPHLSSYESLGFDPLESLGNSSLLTVGAGETAMLWIDAAGKSATAGHYMGELSLLPITTKNQTETTVKLSVQIHDVQLPANQPVDVYTWGPYMGSLAEHGGAEAYVKLALDSHINTFNATYPYGAITSGPSFAKDDSAYLTNIAHFLNHDTKVRFVYSYHLFTGFNTSLKDAGSKGAVMDEQWQAHFITWFGRWMKALENKGVSYDDFWIQVVDEPRADAIPELVLTTAFLKKHFPKVRTMVTVAPWGTMADLQVLAPYIDLWVPESRRLLMRETAADELAFYKKQGDFWPYRCAQQMDMQPLISYYRHRGIQEYVLGAKGLGLWAFNSWGGDSWAQWDRSRADGSFRFDEGLVYRGEQGPVPSTRLFAFRAGIEDYMLMDLLAKAAQGASADDKKRIATLTQQAQTLLDVTDPQVISQWRIATLTYLAKHGR